MDMITFRLIKTKNITLFIKLKIYYLLLRDKRLQSTHMIFLYCIIMFLSSNSILENYHCPLFYIY